MLFLFGFGFGIKLYPFSLSISYAHDDALVDLALWNIDTYIMTRKNRVVAVLKNLEDDSHVKTRLCQYEALSNGKGIAIAKQFLISKIEGQNSVLEKYGLRPLDIDARNQIENAEFESLESARKKLVIIESHNAKLYFNQIFKLFPEKIRPLGELDRLARAIT